MQLKALTVIVMIIVFAVAFVSPSHAKALSNNTTSESITKVTVASGDSLSMIAERNSTTYERLFDANPQVNNPNLIYPGEVINIPGPNEQLINRFGNIEPSDAVAGSDSSTIHSQTPTTPAPVTEPTASSDSATDTSISGIWTNLAQCESGGNWSIDSGNGFYGGLQFSLSSWQSVGGSGYPNQATESEQISRAQMLQANQGWSAWPVCSIKLGL